MERKQSDDGEENLIWRQFLSGEEVNDEKTQLGGMGGSERKGA